MNENNTEYNANAVEKHWQNVWLKQKLFQIEKSTKSKKKLLRFRNVSLSFGKDTYGPC